MSENTLTTKIIADTEVKVAEIKSATQTKVEAIQRETDSQVAALTEAHKALQKKKLDQMELVAVSRAKQDGHIAVQTAKRKQIDAIFVELKAQLVDKSADEYVTFFTNYAKEVIGGDVAVESVEAPAKREEETQKILSALNLSGEINTNNVISAGLIIRTKDGVYDITLERMLSGRRSELEMEVVQKVME